MKANLTIYDLQINGVEVTSITDYIFSIKVSKDFSTIAIKLFADMGASIHFYSTYTQVIFNRKDITNYTLYREEE